VAVELPSVARERLTAQLLAGRPATSVLDVVDRLLAVQAQDPRGARLAVRSRSTGLHALDVDRAINDRELVVSWLNRGTLHLVRVDDYWWLHELTTPQLATSNAARLRRQGVDADAAERGVEAVVAALSAGPMPRAALREHVAAAGVPADGQALVQLLVLATLRGLIVRGPLAGKEQTVVLVQDWLGARPVVDRAAALAELARRYLRGHGPASDRDLARWAGVTLTDARAGMGAIASELVERDDGLVALKSPPSRAADVPGPRLLGSFEPLLLGWASREHVLPDVATTQRLVTDNGLFRPFALVEGRAVATWSLVRDRVTLSPFADLSAADEAALEADGAAVVAFLGS
jgi:hypothetical protein